MGLDYDNSAFYYFSMTMLGIYVIPTTWWALGYIYRAAQCELLWVGGNVSKDHLTRHVVGCGVGRAILLQACRFRCHGAREATR